MWTLCQIILRLCLIHFLGTVSNDYLSQLLPISKFSPQSITHCSPISNAPWLLPNFCHYSYMLVFPSTWGKTQSYPEMIFLPTEIPQGRNEQGVIGVKWWQDCNSSSGIDMKGFDTISIPYITITLKVYFLFRNYLLFFYKFSGGGSDI